MVLFDGLASKIKAFTAYLGMKKSGMYATQFKLYHSILIKNDCHIYNCATEGHLIDTCNIKNIGNLDSLDHAHRLFFLHYNGIIIFKGDVEHSRPCVRVSWGDHKKSGGDNFSSHMEKQNFSELGESVGLWYFLLIFVSHNNRFAIFASKNLLVSFKQYINYGICLWQIRFLGSLGQFLLGIL